MMALPDNPEQTWPPASWQKIYDKYQEHAAWYSGDPNQIADVYASLVQTPTPRGRFWAADLKAERRVMLHVPIAGDIAETSADLLFSEIPEIRIPEASEKNAPEDAKNAQDRLWQIVDQGGIHNRLLEGAESASALGGVFIGPVWDTESANVPLLRIVQADAALPEFRWGMLTAVTLWRVLEDDGVSVWRHLERHEPGVILHGLYRGDHTQLGRRVSLDQRPETADLQDVVTLPAAMSDTLAIRYVPNVRPNRQFRGDPMGSYLGRSDYAGSEALMDALDEVYTSWQRDIRLAKARAVIPEDWLDFGPNGKPRFDEDQEIFVPLGGIDVDGSRDATFIQPEIRHIEHAQTCLNYIERIVSAAGYSPQSFGLDIEGRAESGTALRIRERKSLITQRKKRRYWEPAIEDVLWMMLVIDREIFNSGITVYRPVVSIEDSIVPDMREVAESVEMINRAQAASIETRVRMVHPDWGEDEVQAEVERIQAETGRFVEDPFQFGAME